MATVTRGRILRSDLASWDGKTSTSTRPDATGGTITGLAIGNEVDVLQVYGAGTSRTRESIAAAARAIGSSSATLVFAPGTWVIDSSLTIASNLTCHIPRGCIFDIQSGVTLTFSGPVYAESATSEFATGSGTLSIGATSDAIINARQWYARSAAEIAASVTPVNLHLYYGNVLRYGTNTTPGTTNMTTAIQAAVNANDDVYVPPGTYLSDSITLRSGVRIYGDGHSSIIKQNTVTDGGYGTLYADSGAAGSQVSGVLIENLQILGQVAAQGFSEQVHLIALHGVADATIRDCLIKGFRGDGIMLGSGEESGLERHNSRVKIVNNTIDGVNKDNRNGVSIIDGDDVLIQGNSFVRCTKSTMPGAIDVEPDANVWHVVRGIRVIDNHFEDCGGNVACIGFVLVAATFTDQPEIFVIEGNTFNVTSNAFVFSNNATGYARPFNILVRGNSGRVGDPWQTLVYTDGIIIEGNALRHTGTPQFGTSSTHIVKNVVVANNVLKGDGTANGIVVNSGNAINIHDNIFDAYGSYAMRIGGAGATLNEVTISDNQVTSGVPFAVNFNGGTVTNVSVLDNDFSRATSSVFTGSIPSDTRIRGNKGYVSENGGITASINTGSAFAHGLAATPTIFFAVPISSGPTDVSVAADATNLTLTFGGGGSSTFSWYAAIAATVAI